MLSGVDSRTPTAFLTLLTESVAACFLARFTILRDLGTSGFWATSFKERPWRPFDHANCRDPRPCDKSLS
jgi:hypothetical protein